MRVRIVSDGGAGTKVVDEKGEMLDGVTGIVWLQKYPDPAVAQLTLIGVPVDVVGEVEDD